MSGPHSNTNTYQPETNYEPIYDKKSAAPNHTTPGIGLLSSGPPSYESNYHRSSTYEKGPNHNSHHNHNHHHRHKSIDSQQLKENQANRILAQYETSKGLVDLDMKTGPTSRPQSSRTNHSSSHTHQGFCCDSSTEGTYGRREQSEKKLIDTCSIGHTNDSSSSASNASGNVPQASKFRIPMSNQQRYTPNSGQFSIEMTNDLSRGHHLFKGPSSISSNNDRDTLPLSHAKKPYELLESGDNLLSRKLLDYSPNHPRPSSPLNSNDNSSGPRLLQMAEKDATYSRILEPLMNSKPTTLQNGRNGGNNSHHHRLQHNNSENICQMSPTDRHMMYSYH